MADRDILFRIGVAAHPETQRRLTELGNSVKRTVQQIESSIISVGNRAAEASRTAAAALGSSGGGVSVSAPPVSQPAPAPTNRVRSPLGSGGGVSGAGDRLGSLREDLAKEAKVAGEDAAAALKKQQQDYREETDRTTDALEKQIGEMERLQNQGGQLSRALSSNFREVAAKGEEMASGLGQAASGIAYLFADSDDAKKLIETLLTIKGTTDIVLGSFKSFSGVAQFFSLLSDRSKIFSDRQKNQADQTRVAQQAVANYVKWLEREGIELKDAVGGNQQHADMLRQVAAAANAAAAAEAKLNTERNKPGNRARDIGGALIGSGIGGAPVRSRGGRLAGLGRGIGSLIGFEAISAATGGNGLATGIGSLGLDAVLAGGGGAAAGGGAAGGIGATIGALAAPVAAAAAALGSLALVGKEVQEVFSGTANQVGSVTDTIATWEVGVADWIGDMTGMFDLVNSSGVEAAQKLKDLNVQKAIQDSLTSQLNLIERGGQQKLDDNRTRATSQQRQLAVQGGQLTGVGAAQANLGDNARELAKELKVVSDYQKGILTDEELYVSALERANSLTSARVDLEKAALAAVHEEAAARKALNDSSITAAEQRISLIEKEKGIFKSNEEKINDAAAKFARLSQREQVETIQAQQVAQSGGTLSKKQRERLDSLGLGAEQNAVRQQDLADARKSGFFETFGSFERQQLQGSRARLGGILGLQQQAAAVDEVGLTREQREQRLRALNQAQENIGLAQGRAGSATAGGPSAGERQFDRGVHQVRVEIADRKNFNIQIKASEDAIARAIASQIAKSEKGLAERLEKSVEIQMRKERTAKTADAQKALQQSKNAKPT